MNFEIPQSWTWTTFGEVADYINGRGFSKSEWEEEGRPIIRIQNLTGTGDTVNRYSGEVDEKHIIRDGELLISWSATIDAHIYRGEEAALNQHIFKVNTYDCIEKLFLYYLTKLYVDELREKSQGTGMKHITKGKFEGSEIPLPPISEQKRIVAKIEELFSKLDSGIQGLTKSQDQLDHLSNVWIDSAQRGNLTNDVRYQSEEDFVLPEAGCDVEVPDNAPDLSDAWKWVRFESVLRESLRNGKSAKKANKGVRTLTLTAVTERDFSKENSKLTEADPDDVSDLWLQSGDILIERSNTEEYVGLSAVYRGEDDFAIFPDLMIRARVKEDFVIPEYVDYMFLSPFIRNYLRGKSKGTSGSMSKINQKHLRDLPIPLAPFEEQKRLVERLDHIMSIIEQTDKDVEDESKRAENLRRSILNDAFQGKLVPQDAHDKPADKLIEDTKLVDESNGPTQATIKEVVKDVE